MVKVAAGVGRVVIVIDGVDRLLPTRTALQPSLWLPATLPHNVRVIVSATSSPDMEAEAKEDSNSDEGQVLRNLESQCSPVVSVPVPRLNSSECTELLVRRLSRFNKQLSLEVLVFVFVRSCLSHPCHFLPAIANHQQ